MTDNFSENENPMDISSLPYDDLLLWVKNRGLKPFRAHQIFRWLHSRMMDNFSGMTDISAETRKSLAEEAWITTIDEIESQQSVDGTCKSIFRLADDLLCETVLIPEKPRLTACLSTQVGCRMGCIFCQTGIAGFYRNLKAGEIVTQLYNLRKSTQERITNVVLMGMGEPLDNFKAVADALSILIDDRGTCIGSRKITISTVGVIDGIKRLGELPGQFGLALSLHSGVQHTREKLIPAARKFPLIRLKPVLLQYSEKKKRRITLEYCLIGGINDSLEEASALADFTKNLPCKINLILYNPVQGLEFKRPSESSVKRFMNYLYPICPAVTLRKSRGSDIAGACGQLGISMMEKEQKGFPQPYPDE